MEITVSQDHVGRETQIDLTGAIFGSGINTLRGEEPTGPFVDLLNYLKRNPKLLYEMPGLYADGLSDELIIWTIQNLPPEWYAKAYETRISPGELVAAGILSQGAMDHLNPHVQDYSALDILAAMQWAMDERIYCQTLLQEGRDFLKDNRLGDVPANRTQVVMLYREKHAKSRPEAVIDHYTGGYLGIYRDTGFILISFPEELDRDTIRRYNPFRDPKYQISLFADMQWYDMKITMTHELAHQFHDEQTNGALRGSLGDDIAKVPEDSLLTLTRLFSTLLEQYPLPQNAVKTLRDIITEGYAMYVASHAVTLSLVQAIQRRDKRAQMKAQTFANIFLQIETDTKDDDPDNEDYTYYRGMRFISQLTKKMSLEELRAYIFHIDLGACSNINIKSPEFGEIMKGEMEVPMLPKS